MTASYPLHHEPSNSPPGNAINLALGASNQTVSQPYSLLKSLVAIIFSLIGCYFFSRSRRIHPHRRLTLAASFVVQALTSVAAVIVQRHVVPSPSGYREVDPADVCFIELLPICFLPFQSGGQTVASRILELDGMPTTVVTSLFCDLVSDPYMLAKDNIKRNRRVASAITLIVCGISEGGLVEAVSACPRHSG
ncbi:hypothetical protein V493_05174 [Pseudogymnoascus sp. VKM F-4281 (FW-2241)]|nr:hypothetical protein V493_05174 [Pseudogymnoascus sp. VKM F-4281 (FW-2241)]